MRWLNEPASWQRAGDEIKVSVDPGTDFWSQTGYAYVHDSGHVYGELLPGDLDVSVRVRATFTTQYDQAGIMLRADERCWLIAGVQFFEGRHRLSTVLTLGRSSWTMADLPADLDEITLRASRRGDAVEIRYTPDGGPSELAALVFLPPGREVLAGVMCAAPEGAGFSVTFRDLRILAREWLGEQESDPAGDLTGVASGVAGGDWVSEPEQADWVSEPEQADWVSEPEQAGNWARDWPVDGQEGDWAAEPAEAGLAERWAGEPADMAEGWGAGQEGTGAPALAPGDGLADRRPHHGANDAAADWERLPGASRRARGPAGPTDLWLDGPVRESIAVWPEVRMPGAAGPHVPLADLPVTDPPLLVDPLTVGATVNGENAESTEPAAGAVEPAETVGYVAEAGRPLPQVPAQGVPPAAQPEALAVEAVAVEALAVEAGAAETGTAEDAAGADVTGAGTGEADAAGARGAEANAVTAGAGELEAGRGGMDFGGADADGDGGDSGTGGTDVAASGVPVEDVPQGALPVADVPEPATGEPAAGQQKPREVAPAGGGRGWGRRRHHAASVPPAVDPADEWISLLTGDPAEE